MYRIFWIGVAGMLALIGTGMLWGGPLAARPPPENRPPVRAGAPAGAFSATPTATPVPGGCGVQFQDVPVGYPGWNAVYCVACQGSMSSFPCGAAGEPCVPPTNNPYFRPAALFTNTRGEVARVITLGASWQEPVPSTQQFYEDVPPSNSYWIFIERISGRGIMAGYACGGSGEPCVPPTNRPYFRPGDPMLRSQFAKILSDAAGYSETPTTQTYEDVDPFSPSYRWIERVTLHGLMSGYPCGEPGEPCVPPTNRPYFRPNGSLNVTRAALAQAIAGAFLPGCPVSSPTPTVTGTPPTATTTRPPTATLTPPLVPTTGCPSAWSIVPHPPSGALLDVAARSGTDAWANSSTVTLRWDGATWNVVAGAPPLLQLAAVGPNSAWGVGDKLYHWAGTSWTPVPYPTPFPLPTFQAYNYGFNGVAAQADDDVWIVGGTYGALDINGESYFHWDGANWGSALTGPPGVKGTDGATTYTRSLYNVVASGSHALWAVGFEYGFGNNYNGPIVVRLCNGTPCPAVSPVSTGANSEFRAVTVAGPNDVWAVGRTTTDSLIEHWTGSTWAVVPGPDVGALNDVLALAPNDIWAAGDNGLLHYDGSTWAVVPSPAGAKALAASGPNDIWAAGTHLLHWPDVAQFSDVPPTHTFYPYVQALTCRGLIGGYPCGGVGEPCPGPTDRPYYRPGNPVTRGQTAKIVASAAAWTETPTAQTFEDVPPSGTFYLWVERMVGRGIIGGYPCGSPGEPCVAPTNRPYFRPNNNVTRGQLAKVVSNSAGWSETPTAQTFADVPPANTFYLWVERVASRGIIGGYPCGGAGEPCVVPTNRPYFRPGNNSTRGQTAKIVKQAFFPTLLLDKR